MWNVAAMVRRSPRRLAGWWGAAVLAALLMAPAVPAAGDTPKERASSQSSSGSKASAKSSSSSSRAKASSSRSSSSRPSASSRKASPPSRPRASSPRSAPARPRASSRKAPSPSRPRAASRAREREIQAKRPGRPTREIRAERPSPRRGAPTLSVEPARPNRGLEPPARPAERPNRPNRPNPPSVDPPPAGAGRPTPSGIDRFEPAEVDGRKPDLRRRVEIEDPDLGDRPRTSYRAAPPHRPHDRHRPRYRGYRHRHYYGCGHYGFGYDPFYWGFGFYSPHFYWGLGYHDYAYAPDVYVSGGGGAYHEREVGLGALDLDVRPSRAEVYVDGSYVGVADQYDGFPSYLWLEEGTYELAFYLEGYRTAFFEYTIYPGVTIDVDVHLKRGGPSIRPDDPASYGAEPGGSALPGSGLPGSGLPGSGLPGSDAAGLADLGRLVVVAEPGDAAVYLDGHFVGTAAEIAALSAGLIVEPGDHLIEVIRPGYETESVPISVAAGSRVDLDLDLERR